jgi:hypothetical protein
MGWIDTRGTQSGGRRKMRTIDRETVINVLTGQLAACGQPGNR